MGKQLHISTEQPKDELHGLDKVAERLDVSIWTIRKWCQEGRLSSIRLGARRLIRESEIQRVIAEGLR
jgi:excisionase family DNA binding protein